MMPIKLIPANSRGQSKAPWLLSYHSFSFADYYDPSRMEFGKLRVFNDDIIAEGGGFPTHPHRDMEIVTIVLDGAVAHQDSTGGSGVTKAGQMQHMTAGRGVRHSEFNASKTESLHLLQIWIQPDTKGLEPNYSPTRDFAAMLAPNQLTLIVAPVAQEKLSDNPSKNNNCLSIHQNVRFYMIKFDNTNTVVPFQLTSPNMGVYAFVIEGSAAINGQKLGQQDAAEITETSTFDIAAKSANSHLLLIETPLN